MSGFNNIQLSLGDQGALASVLITIARSGSGVAVNDAIRTSFNGGTSWNVAATPVAGTYFVAGTYSPSRQETLLLSSAGVILRSTDMVTFSDLVNNIGNGIWNDMIWVESLGLYIACGNDGVLTTQRIATSPDGVTWTRRNTVVALSGGWDHLVYNPISGLVVCGADQTSNQPLLSSSDGLTWTRVAAKAFIYNGFWFAISDSGRFGIGMADLTPCHATSDLVTFTKDATIIGTNSRMAYFPPADLFLCFTNAASGINTAPASGAGALTYTSRASTTPFRDMHDMIYSSTLAKLIGIRPVTGIETQVRQIESTDGINYTQTAPGFPVTSVWERIFEAFV